MKLTQMIMVGLCFLTFCLGSAKADPLTDSSYRFKRAGWFPAYKQNCALACRKYDLGHSENEKYWAPMINAKEAHVCKARIKTSLNNQPNTQGVGWVYGNNFPRSRYDQYCMVSTHIYNQTLARKNFYCLCVDPVH